MNGLRVVPKSKVQLQQAGLAPAGGLRFFVDVLHNAQAYAAAGQTKLTYFQTVPTDPGLGNMQAAGQLPSGQFFEIHKIFVDVLTDVTTSADTTGALDDVALINKRGYVSFSAGTVPIFQNVPISFFGRSGGAAGMGWGTFTAEETHQFGLQDDNGGFPVHGLVTLQPTDTFVLSLNWNAAQAISAETYVRVSMLGVRYVPIG